MKLLWIDKANIMLNTNIVIFTLYSNNQMEWRRFYLPYFPKEKLYFNAAYSSYAMACVCGGTSLIYFARIRKENKTRYQSQPRKKRPLYAYYTTQIRTRLD
jgi:hypothetical protein